MDNELNDNNILQEYNLKCVADAIEYNLSGMHNGKMIFTEDITANISYTKHNDNTTTIIALEVYVVIPGEQFYYKLDITEEDLIKILETYTGATKLAKAIIAATLI